MIAIAVAEALAIIILLYFVKKLNNEKKIFIQSLLTNEEKIKTENLDKQISNRYKEENK